MPWACWAPWLLLLLLLWAPARVDAAPAPSLTLDDVHEAVLRTHPNLEVARRGLEAAAGEVLAARGGFDPVLSVRSKWTPFGYYDYGILHARVDQPTPWWGARVFAGYRLGWGNIAVYDGDLSTLSGGEIRAGLALPLWRGGPIDGRRARIRKARLARLEAAAAQDAQVLATLLRGTEAYWDWVEAGHKLIVARELLELAESRQEGIETQAREGIAPPIRVVDNRRMVMDRRGRVVQARRALQQAAVELSLYLRDAKGHPQVPGPERLPPRLPTLTRGQLPKEDRLIEDAVKRHPELAVQDARRRAAAVEVRKARNDRAPTLDLQTFVAKDFGAGPAALRPLEWGIGVTFELPLALRTARGELARARAREGAARARQRGARDRVVAKVRSAYAAVRAAIERVGLAGEQVELAERLAEAARVQAREGAGDLLAVNLRERAAAGARVAEIEARADLMRAHARLQAAAARPPTLPAGAAGP